MDIRVSIFEDNKILRESLRQLIDEAEGMTCAGVFANANNVVYHLEIVKADSVDGHWYARNIGD